MMVMPPHDRADRRGWPPASESAIAMARPRSVESPCSASLLRRELRVRVKLEEATVLTAECSDGQTSSLRRFRSVPERLLWVARMPTDDKNPGLVIIGHKPLGHLTLALWTLHFVGCHSRWSLVRQKSANGRGERAPQSHRTGRSRTIRTGCEPRAEGRGGVWPPPSPAPAPRRRRADALARPKPECATRE